MECMGERVWNLVLFLIENSNQVVDVDKMSFPKKKPGSGST